MNTENIHCSHNRWVDPSLLPCQIFDQWLEEPSGILQAFPLPSAMPRDAWLGRVRKLEAPDGSGSALPGYAVLQQQARGNWRWEELVTTSSLRGQGRSIQELHSSVLFLHCPSQGYYHIPFHGGRPCWFPGLATFTVPGPSSEEIRLGRKEFLSPVCSSPCKRPPPPKISHSAPNLPPQALEPLLSPGAAAPHEVGSSGVLSEMKTFLQVLG